jgi:hypothetical protein
MESRNSIREEELAALLERFVGKPNTEETRFEIVNVIQEFLEPSGRPIREAGLDAERSKMVIEMEVTEPQALALKAMFEYWNHLGSIGASRRVGFYVDGDGNFKPNCKVQLESKTELTDEMRDMSVVEENDGDRTYDFDPIAWKLHEKKE